MTQLDALRIDRSGEEAAGASGRRRTLVILAVTTALVLAAAASAWWLTANRAVEVETVEARAVSTGAGGGGPATVLNASGYVTARRQATVSAKVTGRVREVLVEEGMKVAEGQVLARLDDSNVSRQLELAQAQAESARRALRETDVRLAQARLDLGRAQDLVDQKVSSQASLDTARAEADSLAARLEVQHGEVNVAERTVAMSRQDLEDTVIRAPFAGVAISKDAQPGEIISPVSGGGGFTRTGICTLVDMASLEIEVDVNEAYIQRVSSGQRVEATLDAYPDWRVPAAVITTIPAADRQKATVKVRIGFDQLDARILPDMGVKVAFKAPEAAAGSTEAAAARQRVTIPRSAIAGTAGAEVVWVVAAERAERRAVTVGFVDGEEAQIVAGLTAGERVVADGGTALEDGARVREKGM